MKVDRKKLDILMARNCMGINDLEKAGIPRTTFNNMNRRNNELLPKTVGKIAKALNVDVTEIIKD